MELKQYVTSFKDFINSYEIKIISVLVVTWRRDRQVSQTGQWERQSDPSFLIILNSLKWRLKYKDPKHNSLLSEKNWNSTPASETPTDNCYYCSTLSISTISRRLKAKTMHSRFSAKGEEKQYNEVNHIADLFLQSSSTVLHNVMSRHAKWDMHREPKQQSFLLDLNQTTTQRQ